MEIAFTAGDEVRAAIARLGRTEDVHFSPDGRRLALAGFAENRLLVLDVEADCDAERPRISLTGCLEVDSAALNYPHGLFWVDERAIAVANRQGEVAILELPADRPQSARSSVDPVRSFGADASDLVRSPGSVCVAPVGLGLVELLICNNFVHHLSRHLLDQRNGYALVGSEVLLHDGLEIPDGVAQSPSGRWIAVSNHNRHSVFVFRNDGDLNRTSKPQGVLRGIHYPHGLRFAADERSLLVADAGAPFVRLFKSDDGDWAGERDPSASIRVVSDETFRRGRYTPLDGGPKGIDVTRDGRILVTTCEEQPLAFFDVRDLLAQTAAAPAAHSDAAEAEQAREAMLRYLSPTRSMVSEATEAIRRGGDWEIQKLLNSRSWRITAPLRYMGTMLRKRIPRRWR